MTGTHASPELLRRYAVGDADLAPDVLWAVEGHLETCAACRGQLGTAVAGTAPAVGALVDRVRVELDAAVAHSRQMSARRRLLPRWAGPSLLRYLAMTLLTVLVAVGFDLLARAGGGKEPSLVLLLAPVAPLLGVAGVWARGADPAYELVAATPRAGMYLVLRRTLAVLVVVVPALAAAGWTVGASPVRWLVPCLAFTVSALALGEEIGVPRAAAGLALLWAASVVAPSVASARLPFVLQPASLPGWAVLTVVVGAVLVIRRAAFTRLPSV